MRPRMCIGTCKGATPQKRLENALEQIARLPREKAEGIRHHTAKHRPKPYRRSNTP